MYRPNHSLCIFKISNSLVLFRYCNFEIEFEEQFSYGFIRKIKTSLFWNWLHNTNVSNMSIKLFFLKTWIRLLLYYLLNCSIQLEKLKGLFKFTSQYLMILQMHCGYDTSHQLPLERITTLQVRIRVNSVLENDSDKSL